MKKLLLAVILCGCSALAAAQEIVVAAAADLSSVFPEIASRFGKETGKKVKLNFGPVPPAD
jgi:ABC-type molybdate transport system substrate-binding protein